MNFTFYKLRVGRNDLLLINQMGEVLPDEALLPQLSRSICRRRRGVGANGVTFLFDHPEAGASARFFSRSGTELSRFHDPLYGAARYLFDSGFAGTKALTLETPEGIRSIEAIDSANFRISMGTPRDAQGQLLEEMISTDSGSYISVEGKTHSVTPVMLDQLCGVLFCGGDLEREAALLGKPLTKTKLFNRKFHPLFVQVYSDDDIAVAVRWRKGYGFPETSLAAASAAVAAGARGFTNRSLMTRFGSYDLFVEWTEPGGELLCTGGAEYVFTGEYYLDEESLYRTAE